MKYSILLLAFFLSSNQLKGQLRFANECSNLKTENEGTPAASDGGQQRSICEWAETAYQRCLCEVEKHNNELYKDRDKARIAKNAIIERNKEKYSRAGELSNEAYKLRNKMSDINNGNHEKDYYHRTETTLTASYTDWPGIFSGYKNRAIGYVNSAIQTLQRSESTYNLCVAINMGVAADCSTEKPYEARLNELKGQRQELYDMVYSPPEVIEIKLPDEDDDNFKNVRGNGPVNESDYEAKHIDRSKSYELNLLERHGDYLSSEKKKMLDRDDLTKEQKLKLLDYYTQQTINNNKERRRQYQKDQYKNRPQGTVSLLDYNSIGVGMDYNTTTSNYSLQIAAQKMASNAKFQRDVATIRAVANIVEAGISFFQEQRRLRLERERIALENQRIEDKKIKLFYEQAMNNRKEYRKIITKRQDFFHGIDLNPTNKLIGTTLKPIYIFYAYSLKNYKQFSEQIDYPNKMKFSIKENAIIRFSTVYGVFPQRNLQYPLTQTIKNNILDNYFEHDQNDYDIVFFQWSNNLDEMIEELKKQLRLSVEKHYFYKSVPSTSNEIIFINNKITKSDEIDYWNEKN